MRDPTIVPIDRLELSLAPQPWVWAEARAAEIAAHFAELQRQKPAVWNGRVLLLRRYEIAGGVFRGVYFETDFASFDTWRTWGRPPADALDCFSAGAIIAADGAVLLGVMGAHTANAGRIYFPAGTPEPGDVTGGTVDLEYSLRRELTEETGLAAEEFDVAPGWTTVICDNLIAHLKPLRSRLDAESLRARMLAHLAQEQQPELSDIRIVRGPADVDPAMPPFVVAFLRYHFNG